jgi:hypothetical protein
MGIEGMPEGFEAVKIDVPKIGEWYLNAQIGPVQCKERAKNKWLILRKLEPPKPKYRPFANAEEFKPHADKWLRHRDTDVIGRVCNYSDKGIVALDCGFFKLHSFEHCLAVLTFEDGTPFGVIDGV